MLSFWALQGFEGAVADERLEQVVCVLRESGEITGVSSVYRSDVQALGWRPFWVYRNLLADGATAHERELIGATFEALDVEHGAAGGGEPLGLCVLLEEDARRRLPREAMWDWPQLFHAGWLPDGRQIRIAYFSSETDDLDLNVTLSPGFRIELLAEQDAVAPEDIVALWTEAGVLPRDEAERRLAEVLLVASDSERRPVGVSTVYLQHNEQLGAEFWYYRTFLAPQHRSWYLAALLTKTARDHLEQRFIGDEDTRGIGIIFEIQHEGLRRLFPRGRWANIEFLLAGENPRGDHVRVHYFPGALAPGT